MDAGVSRMGETFKEGIVKDSESGEGFDVMASGGAAPLLSQWADKDKSQQGLGESLKEAQSDPLPNKGHWFFKEIY